MKELDEFLRENKPIVKDDPTFLLETRRRMESVEGIKAEVDRQRSYGRVALIAALALGMAAGAFLVALAYFYPIDTTALQGGLWESVRVWMDTWKQYLVFPVAALAVTLSIVLARGRERTARF